jgi:hypothetical protein
MREKFFAITKLFHKTPQEALKISSRKYKEKHPRFP